MGPRTPTRSQSRDRQKPNHPGVKGSCSRPRPPASPALPPSPPLPGARGWTGAGAHGQHAGVGRHPEAGPVVVRLEHGQTRGRAVGVRCGRRGAPSTTMPPESHKTRRMPRPPHGASEGGHGGGGPPAHPVPRLQRPRLLPGKPQRFVPPDRQPPCGPGTPTSVAGDLLHLKVKMSTAGTCLFPEGFLKT